MQQLADLVAGAEGVAQRQVPDAGDHAVADQLAVLMADASTAGVPAVDIEEVLADLSRELGFR